MAMHGGRVPWDEAGALQGPARTVVAALADVATAPTSLWDIVSPTPDVRG